MGDAQNLFDLAARISIDTANSDKALASTQAKVLNLEKDLKTLQARFATASAGSKAHGEAVSKLSGEMLATRNAVRLFGTQIGEVLPAQLGAAVRQLAYLDSSASAVGEAFAALATPVGLSIAAVGGLALIGAGSAGVLYEMATSAAKTGNDLLSMSQKTGLSVENLQALGEASKITGSSLDRIVMSVGIFEKKLTDADGADTKLAAGFKKLGIDTSDANKALGQVIAYLGKFPAGIQRTGVAMDIFGRSGKDMAAITDEMKGSLTGYTDEMKKMGMVIGTDSVTASRAFIREQEHLGQQWDVIKFKIENAATPIVENWLKDISQWMVKNQADIVAWGETFVNAASAIVTHTGYIVSGLKEVMSLSPIEIRIIETVQRKYQDATAGQ
ncbi:MAG TPA: hypothetical protein DHU55_06510, partial [Blastocatellia bacterium]|nr:hypothetical protein [Blastocatellia bacterium]